MSRRKAKNKLKNNNNVKINGKNKPKTTTNLAQNSEFKVINSQTNNKKCPRPTTTPTNNEITQSIARKISIISKKTKVWVQCETKNISIGINRNNEKTTSKRNSLFNKINLYQNHRNHRPNFRPSQYLKY